MQYKEVAGGICAPKGFAAAGVHCGIRANHSEKYDLALIKADVRCAAAGVYTTNKVCGAPIKVDRAHLTDLLQALRMAVIKRLKKYIFLQILTIQMSIFHSTRKSSLQQLRI